MSPVTPVFRMKESGKKSLEIDFLPVGGASKSGDCILLRYGNLLRGKDQQTVIMIDGGFSDTAETSKRYLKDYYNCSRNGKYHIDYMFLSHPDSDHVNGLVELLKDDEISLDYLIAAVPWDEATPAWYSDGRITKNSLEKRLEDAFNKLMELQQAAKEKGAKLLGLKDLKKLQLPMEARITILGPEVDFYNTCIANCPKSPDQSEEVRVMSESSKPSHDNEEDYVPGQKIEWDYSETTSPINESSLVFLFEYDGIKMLFCGDAGRNSFKEVFKRIDDANIKIDDINIIKMPHHGSRHNVTPEIIDKLAGNKPSCYISCVDGQEGHHPSKRLVNLLREKGLKVYKTAGKGLCWRHNIDIRQGWTSVTTLPTYPKMEKLKH